MRKYYKATEIRATPWLIGFILGYFLFRVKYTKYQVKLTNFKITIGWVLTTIVLPICVFAGHDAFTSYTTSKVLKELYLTLVPPIWALSVSWIIFACVLGYGGPIDRFLSLPLFQILSSLTYSVYLWHLTVMNGMAYTRRVNIRFTDFQMVSKLFSLRIWNHLENQRTTHVQLLNIFFLKEFGNFRCTCSGVTSSSA